jgi:hypothetical protein
MSKNSVFILKLCWGDTKYGQPHTIMYYDSLDKITWLFDRYWDNEEMWIEVVPTKKDSDIYELAVKNSSK